jgi:phosphonate transport system substrate-binding protein
MKRASTSEFSTSPALHGLPACSRVLWVAALVFFVPQVAWPGPITIGSISIEPAAEVQKVLPLARYLARQLQAEGIDHGRVVVADSIHQMAAFVVVADSIHQMAAFVQERKVDLLIDSLFPTVAVSRLSGSRFLLRRWKKGVGEYHTVIFARQDSGISRLEDLKGKLIAFEEPFSTSGYFIPKLALTQAGLHVAPKSEAADPVGPDEVGYVFSYDDESTMVWVLRGKVAAGAMDNNSLPELAKEGLTSLKIVDQTLAIPRHIVSYRADLSPPLVARIREILLQMDQVEEGKKTLQVFERTSKFDDIPEHAMALLLKSMAFIEAEFGLQ